MLNYEQNPLYKQNSTESTNNYVKNNTKNKNIQYKNGYINNNNNCDNIISNERSDDIFFMTDAMD